MNIKRAWLAPAACALVAAACGSPAAAPSAKPSSSSPAPTTTAPATTPQPTPSGRPIDWTADIGNTQEVVSDQIVSYFAPLAKGKGVPGSAPYAGDAHPMAFIGDDAWEHGIANANVDDLANQKTSTFSPPDSGNPLLFTDTSQVQLVGVVTDSEVKAGSCGTYHRTDGKTGELLRVRYAVTVTIRAALTGQVIATRQFTSDLPPCLPNGMPTSGDYAANYGDPSQNPPWTLSSMARSYDGTSTSDPAIKKWIDSFLTGPPR